VAMRGTAPYKRVLTHGFTVDAKGRKMSKSMGNVIVPQKVIKVMGADILRLWVAATDYRAEMSISDEILTRMADSYRRIRNTTRYLLASLSGFETSALLAAKDMLALDQWALQRAHDLQKEVLQAYEEFQFHLIYQKLHQFCVVDMGGFYLDVLKDRMYTMPANSRGRRSAGKAGSRGATSRRSGSRRCRRPRSASARDSGRCASRCRPRPSPRSFRPRPSSRWRGPAPAGC